MLRVKSIAPLRLEPAELDRRQARYQRLGGDRLNITLVNLDGRDAPARMDTAEEIAASERLVAEEIGRTDPAQFDVILPDCVLDPGIADVADPPVPVAGILHLVAGHLASLGQRFAAVTRNQVIGDDLASKVEAYGLSDVLTGVHVLDVDFCLVSDHAGWAQAMRPLQARLEAEGTGTLFNGCSAVDLDDDRLGRVSLVDPTALALRLLAVACDAGLVGRR
ncbi:MAG TPA: aspartate/glutamate racemase family protein [Trebonia sp.]|jgi:Asp/Glu/hydantoin racemase